MDYTEIIHYTCYKDDGTIVKEESISTNKFKNYYDYLYNRIDFSFTGNIGIVCEDINYYMSLSNEAIKPIRVNQLDYIMYEDFYLGIPSDNKCNEFNSTYMLNPSTYYSNELFWGRYLKYKQNSYNISGVNIFLPEINNQMKNSFSFNHQVELRQNANYSINFTFNDNLGNFNQKLCINYGYNPNSVNISIYNQTSLTTSYSKSFYEVYEIGHLNIQFKNSIFSIAIKNRFESYVINFFIPYVFENCSSNNLLLGNYKIDFLKNSYMFNYQNGTSFGFRTNEFNDGTQLFYNNYDYYQISYNLFEIVSIYRKNTNIELKSITNQQTIMDSKGNSLYLVSNQITKIIINFTRNIDECYISLKDMNLLNYNIFTENNEILNNSRELMIDGYSGGGSISFLTIYSSLSKDLLLYVDIYYYVTVIYSTENPNDNLLSNLALNILVPFAIIGVLVFGFKSNSNSKYLGFVGMFVGLFVMYIMEYMSLIFTIICSIILGIGLYFIMKSEKGENI